MNSYFFGVRCWLMLLCVLLCLPVRRLTCVALCTSLYQCLSSTIKIIKYFYANATQCTCLLVDNMQCQQRVYCFGWIIGWMGIRVLHISFFKRGLESNCGGWRVVCHFIWRPPEEISSKFLAPLARHT